ncbi:Na+/H+ antiporter subunit E [Rhizobium sp. NFR03]|uniref:Na+/H+ antiporter subunit E n=1 Tax=Rhizobium sp. NFR03 TaxID=1566263 RepID=UPI0008AD86BC|nr:Na+/H+ antiporter subunit E [Rhizobium sp. NFR03]SES31865.1 multicomponent K+:H+ antiporter subunit E [Rhizobium sp. NFR03]
MRYWFPYPLLSLLLLGFWLLVNQSVSPGQILLGTILSVSLSWAMVNLEPSKSRLRRPGAALRLAASVIKDIAQSNVAVLGAVLSRRKPPVQSAFVMVELTLRDDNALALLACILTTTPGTAWLEYDRQTRMLLIHVLDTADGKDWQSIVTNRYERLLKEIFE